MRICVVNPHCTHIPPCCTQAADAIAGATARQCRHGARSEECRGGEGGFAANLQSGAAGEAQTRRRSADYQVRDIHTHIHM
jgi:hypothetical protein